MRKLGYTELFTEIEKLSLLKNEEDFHSFIASLALENLLLVS